MVGGQGDVSGVGGSKGPKITRIDIGKQKPGQQAQEQPTAPKKGAETARENKTHFTKPSASQDTLAANKTGTETTVDKNKADSQKQENLQKDSRQTETGLKKDYEIKNVGVEAFLKSRKAKRKTKGGKSKKQRGNPPKPNLKTRLSPKGAINPRRPLPAIPGRLKSLTHMNPKDQLQEVVKFMEAQPAYQDPNLIAQYAKQLLAKGADANSEINSFGKMLGLNESIANMDRETIIATITGALDNSDLGDELKAMINDVLGLLAQQEMHPLKPLILLFMPFPFSLMMQDLDEEFWIDDDELFEDEEEPGEEGDEEEEFEEGSEEEQEQVFDKDFHADVEASISISTLNYGKMHINISHDAEADKFKVLLKGDPMAADLSYVLEAALENAMGENSELFQKEMKHWHDNVLKVTESRYLKIDSSGKMNEKFMQACNVILNTVVQNDPENDNGGDIEAEYKVIE